MTSAKQQDLVLPDMAVVCKTAGPTLVVEGCGKSWWLECPQRLIIRP
jgi:hypothetical protein